MRRVDHRLALEALELVLGAAGGFFELKATFPDGQRADVWPAVGARHGLAHYVELHEELCCDQEASLARKERGWGPATFFPVLWCRMEAKDAAARLRATAGRGSRVPVPTIVLREGRSSRYTAFWALEQVSRSYPEILRANERLSWFLGGRRGYANPDNFFFAPPGSVIRKPKKAPCSVMATRCGTESYELAQVVGGLKDAPDADGWRK